MWNLISFAKGHVRRKCLESLYSGPKTPGSVAKNYNLDLSHVSRAMRELAEKDLVECMTPDATKNRIYRITHKGIDIFEKLSEID